MLIPFQDRRESSNCQGVGKSEASPGQSVKCTQIASATLWFLPSYLGVAVYLVRSTHHISADYYYFRKNCCHS